MARTVGPEVLGRWSAGSGPLYRRLADALRTAVARGDVPTDARLPSERSLAASLSVSRSTVVSAYDLLLADGLVARRRGSGTWIAPHAAATARRTHLEREWAPEAALRTIVDKPGDVLPFTASTVDRLALDLPAEAFAVSLEDLMTRPPYFEVPEGLPELRAHIAQMYEVRGLATSPEQIVVTSGAQQAINLVVAAHLGAGDLALIESPTFPGAIDSLGLRGARLRGIPVGADGADVDSIERSVVQGHVGLIYLIPDFHNPTGALMPPSRRAAVAEIADTWHVPVIDDASLTDLSLGARPAPPLASFAERAPVYSVGSLSKLFWGGLRIGWVRCPSDAIGPVLRLKSVSDLSSSLVSQVIAIRLFAHREAMIQIRRRELKERVDLYADLLSRHLPSWRFSEPAGGLSLWVDSGIDAAEFSQAALRQGIAVVPAAALTVDHGSTTFVRLPLALDVDTIEAGVERLARAFRRFRAPAAARRRRERQLVV